MKPRGRAKEGRKPRQRKRPITDQEALLVDAPVLPDVYTKDRSGIHLKRTSLPQPGGRKVRDVESD